MAPRKGRWTWLYDVKSVISASRTPRIRVILPWISKSQTLPTPSHRRSVNNTPVLISGFHKAAGLNRQCHHTRGLKNAVPSGGGEVLALGAGQTLDAAFEHGTSIRHTHAALAKDGSEGSFRQVTWVMGDGVGALARWLVPNLMGACGRAPN